MQTFNLTRKIVTINGYSISYFETTGTGPTVVFIHGNSSSSDSFQEQLQSLALAHFRLICLDLPGHGQSSREPNPAQNDSASRYSMRFYSQVILGFLRAVSATDGFVVGHSLGGHIAMETANQIPSVRGWVVFGAAPIAHPPNLQDAFLPHPASGAFFKEDLSDEEMSAWARACFVDANKIPMGFKKNIRNTHARIRSALAEHIFALDFDDEVKCIAKLKAPIAFFHGEKETLINLDYIRSLSIPKLWHSAVKIIPEAGHNPHLEQPELFNQLLIDFIS